VAAAARGVASAATAALPPAAVPLLVHGAPAGVKAKAGALADAANGQILWSEGLTAKRPMASITKVMTAYLVISAGGLDRKVSIPKGVKDYVFKYGAASAGLKPGEALTVRQLLYALLLASGADAAYTLATLYGPGMNGFIAKMNATAAKLGMKDTYFASPDGLPYPTETSTFSTPYDLMILGLAAMKLPEFRAVVDQQRAVVAAGPGHGAHVWVNDNDLIGKYPGAVGLKTGYTDVALHCLLFEAVRGNRTLIGVVLASPATGPGAGAQDATRILNWGFTLHAQ
jgi:D-alanyl-D-alanine carboxypeptidase (penicillin-binding protein 5/6)